MNNTKLVNKEELDFYLVAANVGISPKIISWEESNSKFLLTTEKYPQTLDDEPSFLIYKESAVSLVKKLHQMGIFHGDINEENFVVNPITKEIKLINFGMACWIDEITEFHLKESFNIEANSANELFQLEINEVEWLCNQKH